MARKKNSELRGIRELRSRKKPSEGKLWTRKTLEAKASEGDKN